MINKINWLNVTIIFLNFVFFTLAILGAIRLWEWVTK